MERAINQHSSIADSNTSTPAMINARLGRLVYGAPDPKAGAVTSLYRLAQDVRFNHRFPVTAGCAPEASVELLQRFFKALRARGEK